MPVVCVVLEISVPGDHLYSRHDYQKQRLVNNSNILIFTVCTTDDPLIKSLRIRKFWTAGCLKTILSGYYACAFHKMLKLFPTIISIIRGYIVLLYFFLQDHRLTKEPIYARCLLETKSSAPSYFTITSESLDSFRVIMINKLLPNPMFGDIRGFVTYIYILEQIQ